MCLSEAAVVTSHYYSSTSGHDTFDRLRLNRSGTTHFASLMRWTEDASSELAAEARRNATPDTDSVFRSYS